MAVVTFTATTPDGVTTSADLTVLGDYHRIIEGDHTGIVVEVPEGETWLLKSADVYSIVVHGVLIVDPNAHVRWVGVNEATFTEAGMNPDPLLNPGLHTRNQGQVIAVGTRNGAVMTRSAPDPAWTSTDQIWRAPTGRRIGTGRRRATPTNSVTPHGLDLAWATDLYPTAEIFNATRSIRFESVDGRPIIHFEGNKPQTLVNVELVNFGPNTEDQSGPGIMGRYPVHFHMMGDGSRGSLVEGVIVTGSGNRAFVAHGSHGVTFRDCIAHNVHKHAFWWDFPVGRNNPVNDSNDILWERCGVVDGTEGGFMLGAGTGNAAIGCWVAGINGAGYEWPSHANSSPNVWDFEDCVTHTARDGLKVWQNDENAHVITRFVAYHCDTGINHGAYTNRYLYTDCVVRDCPIGLLAHASLDIAQYPHLSPTYLRVDLRGNDINLERTSPLAVNPSWDRFIDCTFDPHPGALYWDNGHHDLSTPAPLPVLTVLVNCGITPDTVTANTAPPPVPGTRIQHWAPGTWPDGTPEWELSW